MRYILFATFLLALGGCEPAKVQSTDLKNEVGRFQLIPASGEMPAVLLDTSTGCIEFVERWTIQQKAPAVGEKKVFWVRKQSDEVSEGTPKRCGDLIRYVRDKDGKLVRQP